MSKDAIDELLGDLPDFPGKRPPVNRPGNHKLRVVEVQGDGPRWDRRPRVFSYNGKEIELFEIGALAQALGRKPVTMRAWETDGTLPLANFRTPEPAGVQVPGKKAKGRRLYSRKQIEFMIAAVQQFKIDTNEPNWSGFRTHVAKHWPVG